MSNKNHKHLQRIEKEKVIFLEGNTVIIYLACIFFLFLFGKIFILPIKTILKIIGNSVLGGVLIFIINLIGNILGFHIGLNIITSVIVGILGLPRCNIINYIKVICMTNNLQNYVKCGTI